MADLGQNVDVIVKPHPSNSMKSLKGALKVAGIKNWKIMTDSLYSALNEIDFIIEDNKKSVCTNTRKVWKQKKLTYEGYSDKYITYYHYNLKYPHAGAGKRVQF